MLVNSRYIAKIFNKDVLRAIDKILKSAGISEEFTKLNFKPSAYKSKDGRMLREYNLTRDGFVMVTMGFTGELIPSYHERKVKLMEKYEKLTRQT